MSDPNDTPTTLGKTETLLIQLKQDQAAVVAAIAAANQANTVAAQTAAAATDAVAALNAARDTRNATGQALIAAATEEFSG